MADYSQDLVLALLNLLAPEPPPQGPLASLGPANLRAALRELATRVMGYPDEGEARLLARLWEGCNPIEVLLHLKVRTVWGWSKMVILVHLSLMLIRSTQYVCVWRQQVRLAEAIRPAHAQRLLELARELLTALGPTVLEPAALHLSIHLLLWLVV